MDTVEQVYDVETHERGFKIKFSETNLTYRVSVIYEDEWDLRISIGVMDQENKQGLFVFDVNCFSHLKLASKIYEVVCALKQEIANKKTSQNSKVVGKGK